MTTSAWDRFWAKVDVEPGQCWEWTAARGAHGHGVFNPGTRQVKAYRYAWEILVGPIPDGLVLDHLCRNPPCVNPDHLEPVTPRENWRRGYHSTSINARRTHCVNGHPFDDANTIAHEANGYGRRCKTCGIERARRYQRKNRELLAARSAARRAAQRSAS